LNQPKIPYVTPDSCRGVFGLQRQPTPTSVHPRRTDLRDRGCGGPVVRAVSDRLQSSEHPNRKTYLLRYDAETDEWTLQSGFDGDELLARPSIELVTVDSAIAKTVEQRIESCEHCHPADAEIPFDWLLADVTDKRGPYEFMLSEPVRCPNCKRPITEKTLV
jgi:hypothetical protein